MSQAIGDVLKELKDVFRAGGIETPDADAEHLVEAVTGLSRAQIFSESERILDEVHLKSLHRMTARRLLHEPVSRIIGKRGFWKSDFKITPDTLDPRADSETLIEAAIEHVAQIPQRVLDLGTGTGCLLLSLLQEWPQAYGLGLDISAGAVDVATENALALGLDNRSEFKVLDWNDYVTPQVFDVVISNPPYIAPEEMHDLEPEVTEYDPYQALVGGEDGLEAYRSLISGLPHWLARNGLVFLEIGHMQANMVKDLLEKGGFTVLQTRTDLGGKDRVIVAGFSKT